jgi:hypothetical protein
MDSKNIVRFLLTFFLGWIGSVIINHSSLKPEGWTSRSWLYLILSYVTFGIYPLVASICNLFFDPNKAKNIGYKKD